MRTDRRHASRICLLGLALQATLYALVLLREIAFPFVPATVRLGSHAVYTGDPPHQRLMQVSECLGGASFSVTESFMTDAPTSPVAAWRLAPALRATEGLAPGLTPWYARWIGITGPAWSGCMAMDMKNQKVLPTHSAVAVPQLVGRWWAIVPLSPSPTWLAADWVVCTAAVALALAWRQRMKRTGRLL